MDAALLGRLVAALGRLWPRGWQPADVARIVTRRLGARPGRPVAEALAADRAAQPRPVPPWWDDQLAGLDARVHGDDDAGWLSGWTTREGTDRITALRDAIEVLALLAGLPPVAVLRPPPGGVGGPATTAPGGPSGSRVLDRVRALLAKAESTTFPAEAEAFTGKAEELIARHSLERALVEATAAHPDRPGGVRISTDAPYAGAKALLVQEVAAANRCESVWSDDLGFATVLGFPADLEAVELLTPHCWCRPPPPCCADAGSVRAAADAPRRTTRLSCTPSPGASGSGCPDRDRRGEPAGGGGRRAGAAAAGARRPLRRGAGADGHPLPRRHPGPVDRAGRRGLAVRHLRRRSCPARRHRPTDPVAARPTLTPAVFPPRPGIRARPAAPACRARPAAPDRAERPGPGPAQTWQSR